MTAIKASAAFPEGGPSAENASLDEVRRRLVGATINGVHFAADHIITFDMSNGVSVTLTPQGIEGDELGLTIE